MKRVHATKNQLLQAFLEEVKNNKSSELSTIIGQFGVGFYSCFIVAEKVEVYTKTRDSDAQGYCWTYDGYKNSSIPPITIRVAELFVFMV